MKKKIFAALLAVLLILPMFSVFVSAAKRDYLEETFVSEEDKLKNMKPVASQQLYNDKEEADGELILYFDEFSGELALKNTKTGQILLSNPYNVKDVSDKKLRSQFLSQIYLNYKYINTSKSATYYSYSDCAIYDQLKIVEQTANSITVEYTLGDARERLLLPFKISVEKMDALLEQIPGRYHNYILSRYDKIDIANSPNMSEDEKNAWISQYPVCATTAIYAFDIYKLGDSAGMQRIAEYIEEYTDYTFEQLDIDYEEVYDSTDNFQTEETPTFKFNVKYALNKDGFTAELDAGSIQYNKNNYYIENIAILPYFGAANRNDKGYTFVPDGSGALIRFEDILEKGINDTQTITLYGSDYSLYYVSDKNVESKTMPVFGLVNTSAPINEGYFAIIEQGDALATVISYHKTYYHSIYSTFKLTATDEFDLADAFSSGQSSSQMVGVKADPDDYYDGICKVRYVMLSDGETNVKNTKASYTGMAEYYREYLVEKGTISKLEDVDADFTRIFLEVFGSINVEEKVLSFPINVNKPLTTFSDVKTIHQELTQNGVGNMSFILKGFANGGLSSKYPTYVKWQRKLGGADGLQDLLEYAKTQKDLVIAPEFEFTYSQELKMFSGFKYKKTAVRTLDNRYSTKREYNAATQTFERTGGVAISSASFELAYTKFYKSISKYDVTTLSVRSLGSNLNSDYDKKGDFYDREDSKANVVNMLGLLSGEANNGNKGYNLIIDAGNSYALPYADAILSASLDSSRFNIQSEAVPFYGMVLHGYKEFAGNAINMDGDSEYMFLKALENGASLYFTLAYQNGEYLKFDPVYNKYYSLNYSELKDDIINMYNEYNSIMASKQELVIVKHDFMNAEYGYNVVRKSIATEDKESADYALNNSNVVLVMYGESGTEGSEGFILNYNSYRVYVTDVNGNTTVVEPFGYVQVTANQQWK